MKKKVFYKLRFLSLVVTGIIALSIFTIPNVFFGQAAETTDTQTELQNSEVVSYVDVFDTYYDLVLDSAEQRKIESISSFSEFCSGYYDSGMDLPTYTDSVIEAQCKVQTQALDYNFFASNDADYILPQTDYNITPANAFVRLPTNNIFDFSAVKEGDVVYETSTILFNAGHNAIIYDMSKQSENGDYIQTIEAVGSGVTFGFLDDTRMVDFAIIILRVKGADDSKVSTAKYFCHEQLGKDYFLNPVRLNTDINSSSWYCSELIYAAYKYAGIDIGVKKDSAGNDVYLSLGCIPSDIYKSYNTYSVHIPGFLDIKVLGKQSGKWTIEVLNHHSYDIVFEYNARMCFKGDAEKWSGMKDLVIDSVSAGESTTVIISENVFATTVAFSCLNQTKRYITYGYQLSTDGTMKVVYTGI